VRFVCRDPRFCNEFAEPILDLGYYKPAWRGGGAMRFQHI
jgi:hypothetical protein